MTQRADGRHVDDFGADAFGFELVSRFEGFLDHRAPGHQRDIGAVAQNEANVQWQVFAVVFDFFLVLAINTLGLKEDDRVRVANRGQQQAIGPRRR